VPRNLHPSDSLLSISTLSRGIVTNSSCATRWTKKTLDTVARETVARKTVAQIHGRLHYQTNDGNPLYYLSTYLSLWFNDRDWNKEPFILFSYRPLKEQIGLESDRKYFTFAKPIT